MNQKSLFGYDYDVKSKDIQYTPDSVAEYVVNYFRPSGHILDPCKGDGAKTEEYRLVKPYWVKRLLKDYDKVHILCGYPQKDDKSKRLVFQYNGYTLKQITHKHFGNKPVKVFAIRLANNQDEADFVEGSE